MSTTVTVTVDQAPAPTHLPQQDEAVAQTGDVVSADAHDTSGPAPDLDVEGLGSAGDEAASADPGEGPAPTLEPS